MIACDALQNWVEPDEFFDAGTIEKMREMGFLHQQVSALPGFTVVNRSLKILSG